MDLRKVILKSCLAAVLCSFAIIPVYAAPWIQSPSAAYAGDDLEITGGGAPSSTDVLINAVDASGQILGSQVVTTSSAGEFSHVFTLDVTGAVDFQVNLDGSVYESRCVLSTE